MSTGCRGDTRTVRSWTLALTVFFVASLTLGGFVVGTVAADDSAPGEPASFFGSANDTDGDPIPANETIVAVVDGDRLDSIPVDPSGKYGGEGAFDDKIRVDSEAGDEVVFRFADREGPIGGTAELEPGVFETNLTFSTDVLAYVSPDAAIEIDPVELPPEEDVHLSGADATAYVDTEVVSYDWSIKRDGDVIETFTDKSATYRFEESGTYDVELEVTDGKNRTNATTETFEISSEFSVSGETDDGDDSGGGETTAGGTSGGGGGGSVGGSTGGGGSTTSSGESSSDSSSTPTDTTDPIEAFSPSTDPIAEETVRIDDAFPDTPGTTVDFNRSAVGEILFDDGEMSGDVIVREFGSATDDTPPLPDDLRIVSAVVLTVPPEHRNSSALIRSTVDPERLKANNQIPSKLSVYRLSVGADQWEKLPTDTLETHDGVVVEAETPGFSQFVIAAPETPELIGNESAADDEADQRDTERETAPMTGGSATGSTDEAVTDADDAGLVRPVGALIGLLVIVGTVGRIIVPRRRGR